MTRKSVLVFVLAALAAGGVFAQTDFRALPKNTLTVDLGPTLTGLAIGKGAEMLGVSGEGMSTSGFGIAAQYERQLFRRLSVAGRFAYLKFGAGLTDESQGVSAELNMDISSWSAEGHVRLYPFGQTFFLNGMVGYGHISMPLSGELVFEEGNISERRSVKLDAVRKYVKYGGKLGWRIDFGRPGGFTFEPSLGYYGRVGLGDTLWTQLMDSLEEQGGEVIGESDGAEQAFSMLEQYVFIGGPRVSLSFGWRF